jgi:hypothetical protein
MRLGRIIGSLVATGGVAVFGATGSFDDNTTRNEQGEITEAGGVGVFVLEVGDCIQLPDGATEVQSLEGVPCDQPHDAQLFAQYDMSEATYPSEMELQTSATQGCDFNWLSVFGVERAAMPDKDMSFFYPLAEGWDQGDRKVQCLVVSMDGLPFTGDLMPGAAPVAPPPPPA